MGEIMSKKNDVTIRSRALLFACVLVGTVICAGCADPETSRLAVGSKAMVLGHYRDQKGAYVRGIEGMVYPTAEDGTRVTVVNDEEQPDRNWGTREVRVRILDGPLRDRTGEITRFSLRPE
jgi:hypothetical protein